MKNLFLLTILFLAACTSAIKDEKSEKETPESVVQEAVEEFRPKPTENLNIKAKEDLIGYWVGWFEPDIADSLRRYISTGEYSPWGYANKINLSIDSFNNDSVYGHSVVANNFQIFKGIISLDNEQYTFETREPGNDKHDGIFKFIIKQKDSVLSGKWSSYEKLETSNRVYKLYKRNFKYNPLSELDGVFIDWEKFKVPNWVENDTVSIIDGEEVMNRENLADLLDMDASEITDNNIQELINEYLKYEKEYYSEYLTTTEEVKSLNSSSQLLTKEQVENLTKADIYVLRNSIYARHGYSFRKRQLRAYFDRQEWYIPVHANIKSDLTEIEKKNIQLLLKYEEHAEEYYDEFGRG